MSRWSEGGRPHARKDDGFSLIEVVVALGILMVLVTALLPQLVVGIRSTSTSREVTQAKGLAQAELERMRNLPYHVSSEAGAILDVFDYYYTNLTAPTTPPTPKTCMEGGKFAPAQPAWAGYVSKDSTNRCTYEPANGIAFYRSVRKEDAATGIGAFMVVTSTYFLSTDTPPKPVVPEDEYDTRTAVDGEPASAQIGVTVTVLNADRATGRPTSISTQIARQPPLTTRIRAEAAATAVEIRSATPDGVPVTLTAGLLSLTGSLTHSSNVTANLTATSAGLSTGEEATGASASAAAPPSAGSAVVEGIAGGLGGGCTYACWAPTRVEAPAVSAADGLPVIGKPNAPAQSLLLDKSANRGLSFRNGPVASYRPELEMSASTLPPLVSLHDSAGPVASGVSASCTPGVTGSTKSFIAASGYLLTTATGVESCAAAQASWLSVLPTSFAQQGVVRIQLIKAAVRCQVSGSNHVVTATPDYEAVVEYWNGTAYKRLTTIKPSTPSNPDPLDAIVLATTPIGGGKMLGDYIESWSSLTKSEVTSPTGSGSVELPGVVSLRTRPVRDEADGESESAVSLRVGVLRCSAMDAR